MGFKMPISWDDVTGFDGLVPVPFRRIIFETGIGNQTRCPINSIELQTSLNQLRKHSQE